MVFGVRLRKAPRHSRPPGWALLAVLRCTGKRYGTAEQVHGLPVLRRRRYFAAFLAVDLPSLIPAYVFFRDLRRRCGNRFRRLLRHATTTAHPTAPDHLSPKSEPFLFLYRRYPLIAYVIGHRSSSFFLDATIRPPTGTSHPISPPTHTHTHTPLPTDPRTHKHTDTLTRDLRREKDRYYSLDPPSKLAPLLKLLFPK